MSASNLVLYTSKSKTTLISATSVRHGRVGWMFEDPVTGEPFPEPKALYWFSVKFPNTYPDSWVELSEFIRMSNACAKERARRFLPQPLRSKRSATVLQGEGLGSRHYAV